MNWYTITCSTLTLPLLVVFWNTKFNDLEYIQNYTSHKTNSSRLGIVETNGCSTILTTKYMNSILENRSKLPFFGFDYYKTLSLEIKDRIDREGYEFPVHRIDQMSGSFSWVGCKIRRYQYEDFQECIKGNGNKLRIFFIGDSRARQLFEANLLEMKSVPLAVYGSEFLMKDHKMKLILSSAELQNNSNVLFKYFSTLNSTALFQNQPEMIEKHLQTIVKLPASSFPDLIVISFIQWSVFKSGEETLNGFDEGMKQMKQMAKMLSGYAPKILKMGTKLVWLLVDDIKRYSFNHNQGYSMEWYNQIVINYLWPLINQGVISLWDSGFPITQKVFQECELREKKNFFSYFKIYNKTDQDKHWKCSDFSHVGPQGTRVHIQFLYNLVCNKFIRSLITPNNFCCS